MANWKKIGLHFTGWLLIYIIYKTILSYSGSIYINTNLNAISVVLYMLAYYGLRYFQIPHLLKRKKYIPFVLSLIASSVLLYITYKVLGVFIKSKIVENWYTYLFSIPEYLILTIRFYSPALALIALEFFSSARKEKEKLRLLEKEKLSSELNFLKTQFNPAFLINVLKGIKSKVAQQSSEAPELIMNLSHVLDYTLYTESKTPVALEKESDTISKFLELQKSIWNENIQFDIDIQNDHTISHSIVLRFVEEVFQFLSTFEKTNIRVLLHSINKLINCKIEYSGKRIDMDLTTVNRQLELSYLGKNKISFNRQSDFNIISLTLDPEDE